MDHSGACHSQKNGRCCDHSNPSAPEHEDIFSRQMPVFFSLLHQNGQKIIVEKSDLALCSIGKQSKTVNQAFANSQIKPFVRSGNPLQHPS